LSLDVWLTLPFLQQQLWQALSLGKLRELNKNKQDICKTLSLFFAVGIAKLIM